MSSFQCPYCQITMPITFDTCRTYTPCFSHQEGFNIISCTYDSSAIAISFYKCPNCGEFSIFAEGMGESVSSIRKTVLKPMSLAKQFPDYVPEAIRSDYEEACAIVSLSPKASATLSRRCLQGMIRDFWKTSKKSLYEEIDAIKDELPAEQWRVLDGVRRIGNIGVHMEKDINLIVDIEPDEAQKLIKLIELLINQWYIERYNQQQLYADIIGIDESKQQQRKKTE